MPLEFFVDGRDLDLDGLVPSDKELRRVLQKSSREVAARLRLRFRQRGILRKSGQLGRSIKSRVVGRRGLVAIVGFLGIRKDGDTHKNRGKMTNFAIAAFHNARGIDALGLTDQDEEYFRGRVEQMIFDLIEKKGIEE